MANISLDESIDIIQDCLTQFFEERNYSSYITNLPNMEEKIGYQQYREALGLVKEKKVNVDKVRENAQNVLDFWDKEASKQAKLKAMKGGI